MTPGLQSRGAPAGIPLLADTFWTGVVVLGLLLAIAARVFGQSPTDPSADPLKQLTLEQLSQIEISSVTKESVPAFKTPAAISVMTSEQIQRSGARTIPDLLRLIPGVNVAQIDSSEWAVGIRGFQGKLSRSVLVLIDGRTVYTPLFAGVYWDMQGVLLEDIARIEVIRGPGGTIWGSNAVNGVINIITKSARDTRGSFVSAGGGNVDQASLQWRYGGGSDDTSYRVYGSGFTRGPMEHPDGRNFDDWRRGSIGFRVDSRLSDRDELTIQGDAYGGEAGQRLQLSSYAPPSISAVEGEKRFNGENVMATWHRTFSPASEILFRAYFDRTDRQELNYREIRNTFDFDFIHHLTFSRHDITWGLGARTSPSHFFETVPTVLFIPPKQTYNILSAFFQDEITLVPDKLALTIGSKFEYTTFSNGNYQPSARIAWTPTSKQTAWAAVTRAVRTASEIEDGFNFSFLAQPATPLYLRLIGDGQFHPEQLIGYEVGYRNYVSKRGFIGLSLFHNRYTDLLSVESSPIVLEPSPLPAHFVLPLRLRNGVAANSTGGELSAIFDIRPWWRLRGSYSLVILDARHEPGSNDASTIGQLEGDTPRHSGVVQSTFQLPRNFDLTLAYRAVGAVPDQRVRAYSTADVRVGWRGRGPWDFEVVGQNLLQPAHVEYGGTPGPLIGIKRSFYAGIKRRH